MHSTPGKEIIKYTQIVNQSYIITYIFCWTVARDGAWRV